MLQVYFTPREKRLSTKLNSEGLKFLFSKTWPMVSAVEMLPKCCLRLSHVPVIHKSPWTAELFPNFLMEKWLFLLSSWNISDRVSDLLVTQGISFVVISLARWRTKSIACALLALQGSLMGSWRAAGLLLLPASSAPCLNPCPGIQGDPPREDQWCLCGVQIGCLLQGSSDPMHQLSSLSLF